MTCLLRLSTQHWRCVHTVALPVTVPWTGVLFSGRHKTIGRGNDREGVGESEVNTDSFVFIHYFCSCSLYATKQLILSFFEWAGRGERLTFGEAQCFIHSDLINIQTFQGRVEDYKLSSLKAVGGGLQHLSLTVFTSEYCSRPYSPLEK